MPFYRPDATKCRRRRVGRAFAWKRAETKNKRYDYECKQFNDQGTGGVAGGLYAGAATRAAGHRAAAHALGAHPRRRRALHVPAGTRRRQRARPARRGRPRRGFAAAGDGRKRRTVFLAGRLARHPACGGLHKDFRRQVCVGRTSAARPDRRTRCGGRPAETCGRYREGAHRGDPHLPQGGDRRFADRGAGVQRIG